MIFEGPGWSSSVESALEGECGGENGGDQILAYGGVGEKAGVHMAGCGEMW